MDKVDEQAVQLICRSMGLESYYDAYDMRYVFRRKIDPHNVCQSLERCFGQEPEYIIGAYALRRMDSIFLYQRLSEVFCYD